MNTKRVVLMALIVLAAVIVSSCSRKAATPPPSSGTLSVPVTQQSMGQLGEAAMTQTAQAVLLPTQPPQPTATFPPPVDTATPMPVIQPTLVVPAVVQPTPLPLPRPEKYTLQKDEFPYCIARRFDVNPDELLRMNGLSKGTVYYPNLELKIPASGSFPGERALKTHPTTYTVKAGDTIYSIACGFGDVAPEAIASYNNLQSPYKLTVGQVLNIP